MVKPAPDTTLDAAAPPGHRAYAIGDIHGRLDLLDRLLEKIEQDRARREPRKTSIIFLGDLVDRGPESRQVVERLRTYRPKGAKAVFLLGNHEEVLLRCLSGEEGFLDDWFAFGGEECMTSYGLDPARFRKGTERARLKRLRSAFPSIHAEFLRGFVDTVRFGDYLFVHAGVRPGVPLEEQRQQDLRWIRQPFLDHDGDLGAMVVHGHSITPTVELRTNRIGIDTGAYHSGILTALGLEGTERWILDTAD